jgi:hypothetical protein
MVMHFGMAIVVASLMAWLPGSAFANTIYNVDIVSNTVPASATGTITTDGTLGVLHTGNIVGFDLLLQSQGASFALNDSNGVQTTVGDDLTATATGLFFDFNALTGGHLLFLANASISFLCFNDAGPEPFCNRGVVTMGVENRGGDFSIGTNQIASVATTPIPATLPLLVSAIGGLGLLGWRRRGAQRWRHAGL